MKSLGSHGRRKGKGGHWLPHCLWPGPPNDLPKTSEDAEDPYPSEEDDEKDEDIDSDQSRNYVYTVFFIDVLALVQHDTPASIRVVCGVSLSLDYYLHSTRGTLLSSAHISAIIPYTKTLSAHLAALFQYYSEFRDAQEGSQRMP